MSAERFSLNKPRYWRDLLSHLLVGSDRVNANINPQKENIYNQPQESKSREDDQEETDDGQPQESKSREDEQEETDDEQPQARKIRQNEDVKLSLNDDRYWENLTNSLVRELKIGHEVRQNNRSLFFSAPMERKLSSMTKGDQSEHYSARNSI